MVISIFSIILIFDSLSIITMHYMVNAKFKKENLAEESR